MRVSLADLAAHASPDEVLGNDKDPASVQFGAIKAVRNNRGLITVCGEVNGRNTAGSFVGMLPFVGGLVGPDADADFVLVGIGSSERDRAEVTSLCRATGLCL
ncbi:MAG: hypothetical protein QOJ15_11473 [Bradyrhizobium sp.]|nr:hypothetical protein [Bradyrhizobium sp.]